MRKKHHRSFIQFLGICGVTLGLLVWQQGVQAANLNCDELEGDPRTYCLTMIVCHSLDNLKARDQCIEAAANIVQSAAARKPPDVVVEKEPVQQEKLGAPEVPVKQTTTEQPPQTLVTELESSSVEESESQTPSRTASQRVFEQPAPDLSSSFLTSENAFSRVDPDQFSAAIVYFREIDYDNALVVLENGLVFEAVGVERSRFDMGDTIVAKRSQRAARQHYILTGGEEGSISGYRVRCETQNPSKKTRVRCALANSILRERHE